MTNRIVQVEIRDHTLIAAEADVRVVVVPERIDTTTEVRGRFLGPQCLFAETIEVAYPLRRIAATGEEAIFSRVVIPEASFWDPMSPHLYLVLVELWQDGQRVEEIRLRHGLRDLRIGPRGLRINGRSLPLRGQAIELLNETQARELRQAGFNLLVAPATHSLGTICDMADRVGFFVLGEPDDKGQWPDDLARHPSFLGWLAPGQFEARPMEGGRELRVADCADVLGILVG